MKLVDLTDGWALEFQDGRVGMIQIDFRVGFMFSDRSDSATLHIESPFVLNGPGSNVNLNPEESSGLGPILALANSEVKGITIASAGQLRVEFMLDHWLEVDPDDRYEAWQLSSSLGFLMVCAPGGSVAFFTEADRTPKSNRG